MEDENIVLSKTQYEELKKNMYNEATQSQIIQYAKQLHSTIANNEIISQKKNLFAGTRFNSSNVSRFLSNPQKYQKELRQLSMILTTLSPQYMSITQYLPSICRFCPMIIPNLDKFGNSPNVKKIEKEYNKAISYLDMLNIPHEFLKVVSVCAREDIFYGYEYEGNNSYYIQQLDSDYCKITSIEDGCFNFAFNFEYFDKNNKIEGLPAGVRLIDTYPQEFQQKYKKFLADKTNSKWQELEGENTICIKFLEDIPYCFPPYANLFNDIADLSDYKELNKSKKETENYKFIGLQIPTLSKSEKADDFAVDPNTALAFYNMIQSSLPQGIGAFISATDFKSIDFNTSKASEKDSVDSAEDNIFTSSGISPINFGKGTNNEGTVKYSNMVDQTKIFKLYTQLERWLNRKFKYVFKDKFQVHLMRVSEFNLNEAKRSALTMAQYGLPNKLMLTALNGISQQMERGLSFLENEVLFVNDKWKPLQSSHTQSSNSSSESEESKTKKEDNSEDSSEEK